MPTAPLCVLVVDDEPHIGRIIRTRLEQASIEVLLAEDGPQALSALAARPDVHLIVLDLMLPGISGLEVLRTLRADARWLHIPCIVLTAAGQDAQLREAERLGVAEVMTKPFSPRGLLERVHRYALPAASATHRTLPD